MNAECRTDSLLLLGIMLDATEPLRVGHFVKTTGLSMARVTRAMMSSDRAGWVTRWREHGRSSYTIADAGREVLALERVAADRRN